MKSRSHRLPVANPQEDWVDGSWTVDCVCGVNFDDGEEMVNCDDCGVWVHTRCVRYVKSEKLFACDKCKNKARRNDSEETEVAQLLVELPTKTLTMNSPYPNSVPIRKPFRLWTDLPMEERVHVQGLPGGDPALFSGLSSVFSRELWKCSGYVPKKFNFQYREFPCWENETIEAHDNSSDKGNEMTTGNGAGTLFSLSKENFLLAPVVNPVSEKPVMESNTAMDSVATTRATNDVKKSTGFLGPSMIQDNKRKKEEFGMPKDQSGKKMSKVVEKEDYLKKDAHTSRPGPVDVKTDVQRTKFGNSGVVLAAVDILEGPRVLDHDSTSFSVIPTSKEPFSKVASCDVSKRCSTSEAHPREDKIRNHVPARVEDSPMENDGAATNLERSDSASLPMTDEVVSDATNNKEEAVVLNLGTESQTAEPMIENVACLGPNIKRQHNVESSSDDKVICSSEHEVKLTAEVHADPADLESQRLLPSEGKLDITQSLAKHAGTSSGCLSEKAEVNATTIVKSEYSDCKLKDGSRKTTVGGNNTTNTDESPSALCQSNQEPKISEVTVAARKSSGHKQSSKPAEDAPRSSLAVATSLSALNHHKIVLSTGKSSSGTTKSSAPENRTSSKAHNHDSNGKVRGMYGSNLSNKRERSSMDAGRDEERRERPKKMLKEHSKSSVGSASKTLQLTKLSHAPVKKTVSEAKESVSTSAAKTSIVRSNPASSRSAESSTSLQSESAAHIQNKATGLHLTQKCEKINQPSCQPSSKVNTHQMHPPPSSSPPLSDEALALLLHQELNSSPRVPRVPRMRHAGSLPQLTSPTSTSMAMKRTSSGGGKDHGLTSRRKSKDIGKDGSNCSQEVVQKTKKSDRSTSPVCRREEDSISKREGDAGSAKSVQSLKKSSTLASNTSASSSLCSLNEANEQNLSSMHNSPSAAADDDAKVAGHPSHQTLPALIAEIMSKGQRMTYEELCNAVLPHWPNLRKHNGERYAYSSHSQAVLDCLRNRSEWSRMVDRGPKTSTSRKRRKHDVDSQFTESEDNEDCMDRAAKDVRNKTFESKQEDFPKGKRKARKRRRLALKGRGIKDVRRRHRAKVISDEEIGSSSESGRDSMFSEDEAQGDETSAGNEASASSDDRATVS
ncbi:hypothetical protein T459_00021 [Capsicum annuum]|uniref:Zinc finger PHD-type domain-containing protein n=1 Tax=Capsicum annuum TaxID=4072 RepID=A0A2G3AD12_CAPAN|nr:uncharacterized protein LOC107863450 [Capsicum annuum]XP_016564864.2 uncharacterized protein LOC107863450 [Capsicum annuum]PHT92139.1 hypothetical protein T459_00021 [Capsicum annuum]